MMKKWTGRIMHAKTDSDVTSISGGSSSQSRSPWRFLYYVKSPWNRDDVENNMPHGSIPSNDFSPPINQSRELSTWKKLHHVADVNDSDNDDEDDGDYNGCSVRNERIYWCFAFWFFFLLSVYSLIFWGATKAYKPKIFVKHIVFHSFNIQAGMDLTGVPTAILSLNSTVKIFYRNPDPVFRIHVSSTPLELYYDQLKIASGDMEEFYEPRKSYRDVVTVVLGHQVPLYGADVTILENVEVPLNLTFTMRSSAHILGKLVKSKFYKTVSCSVTLRGNKLDKPNNLTHSCSYNNS